MSLEELLDLYEEVRKDHPKLSLSSFASEADISFWKLRDARQQANLKAQRIVAKQDRQERIRNMALSYPTCGYRSLHSLLRKESRKTGQPCPGRHEVRLTLAELNLNPPLPRRVRRKVAGVVPAVLWPAGRRIQIDATRFALGDGVSWAYVVLDVETRAVLNIHVVRSLSASSAVTALRGGIDELKKLGIEEPVVVMSDGGSDFTSHEFGAACDEVGTWVRAKVSQKGGMGILERVNRTLKYEFIFRREPKSKAELGALCAEFRTWYNTVRPHSALGYDCPWAKLLEVAESLKAA